MKDGFLKQLLNRRQLLVGTGASLLLAGCGIKSSGKIASPSPSIVQAKDNRSRVQLLPGWEVQQDLNDGAEIQIGDRERQVFLIVLTELKKDFADDVTYLDHARMTLSTFQNSLENVKKAGVPASLVING